jgi:hypothetical protein
VDGVGVALLAVNLFLTTGWAESTPSPTEGSEELPGYSLPGSSSSGGDGRKQAAKTKGIRTNN